jgi:hypothetical protein
MPRLEIGKTYTRDQINKIVGGGVQSFLPTKNGYVVCGCFKLDQNPDAPNEVLVGVGPQREGTARLIVLQQTPIPIFLKREIGEWEYVGKYMGTRYLDREHRFLADEERTKKPGIAGILYMHKEPVEAEAAH